MIKKVDAILVGDLHLMERTPECRTDNFFETQLRKLKWLRELQNKHGCPVLCSGDVFDRSNPSHFLVDQAIINLPKHFYFIAGQHDLPQNTMKLFPRSPLRILSRTEGKFHLTPVYFSFDSFNIAGFDWGEEATTPFNADLVKDLKKVAVRHVLTWHKEKPFPDCKTSNARSLLKKMSDFDLILTGDNHKAFVVEKEGRLLVNPGSFTRIRSDQIDFKPRVYLWYSDDNSIERIYVPINKQAVSRSHLENSEAKDKRIQDFVSRLNQQTEIGLSFVDNMKRFL